jgi:hypothetical protein
MNKKNAALILAGILLFACGLYFLFTHVGSSLPDAKDNPGLASAGGRADQPSAGNPPAGFESDSADPEDTPAPPVYHPKDIQEIKKQLYDLKIEYVEDIPKLDNVVQTGNTPTRDFWTGDWMSVDDFKDEANGFNLEPQGDGTFIFYPDENTAKTYTFFETPRTYSYDPAKKEFSWEMDYYGKTISHRARFINDNVLVTMLISGRKVTLDIYQKQPERSE